MQDNKDKKGEIFGLANLFSYQGEGVVLQEIINKTNIAESRIGVAVAGLDMTQVDDEDDDPLKDEDAAMRHLNALIDEPGVDAKSKRGQTKTDPIQAILSNAGVEYTHENSEVIGTSKTEARISRKAAEDTISVEGHDRAAFALSDLGHGIKYRYRPPEEVRKRQFCSMAKAFGFASATEFALVVEGWTQEQRRNCLEKFYTTRRQTLLGGGGATTASSIAEGDVALNTTPDQRESLDVKGKNGSLVATGTKNEDNDMTDDEL